MVGIDGLIEERSVKIFYFGCFRKVVTGGGGEGVNPCQGVVEGWTPGGDTPPLIMPGDECIPLLNASAHKNNMIFDEWIKDAISW